VSNPDSPGPYWEQPVGSGRHGKRTARPGEGRYDREEPYGRPAPRPAPGAYGRPAGNGQPNDGGRPEYGRPNGGNGYGRPNGGNGYGGSNASAGGGNGNGGGPDRYRSPDRGGRAGHDYPREAQQGPRQPDRARGRGSQASTDLRARLGLGNGQGGGSRRRGGEGANWPGEQGRPYPRDAQPPGQPGNGGRPSAYRNRNGNGNGGRPAATAGGPGGRRVPGQAEAKLRARLGLGSAPAPGTGAGYGSDNGYGGPDYGGGRGVSDYVASPGRRGGTALRDRRAAGYTGTRVPGIRRPSRRGGYPGDGGPGDGGGPRTRRKGDWWRHWTWRKALAVAAGGCAAMILVVMAAVLYLYAKTQIPTEVDEAALQQSSTVYFSNGKTEVGTFTADGIDRQMLTANQIPAVMKNAIIAAEDRHFYSEGGISVSGILRSAYEDLKGGGNLQGGSTLTEEFVKNYYSTVGTSRTISTKLKEIFISIKLSHEESKDWILTEYLNTVPFGDNAYGVAAAAQIYFNEPASKLTVSQAAMLAAMVNQPGFFNPNPSAGLAYTSLVARWRYVLTNMVRDGALTQAQANAEKFPSVAQGQQLSEGWTGYRGYIMQAVENELENTYGFSQNEIDSRGLRIVTTFNLKDMRGLYQAVDQNLRQMRADGHALPIYAHVGALLEQPGTGAILAEYGGPSFSAANCVKIDCQYNMATESRNLVGSSFKPYVLATAVKEGMDVQNSVLNAIEPMCVPPDSQPLTPSLESTNCPPSWFQVNIPGENMGAISVVTAAAQSSDPAFEDLVHRAGTQATIDMAKAFGVNVGPVSQGGSGLQAKVGQVGMALGTASLTVEEQATTFATLAADGEYATPHVIASLSEGGNPIPIKVTHREVLTAAQAADVDYALSFDTVPAANGTASEQGVLDPVRPTIGKTGTTDQAQSAFFIGAIPQYSLAVGMFTNSQNELPGGETLNILPTLVGNQTGGYGGAWPTAIWRTYMQNEFSTLPIKQLPTPDYVGFTKWDQVPSRDLKPKPSHRNPNQGQGQNPCPPGQHRVFGLCVGSNPTPTPAPTTAAPTPTPSASNPAPFGGTETTAAELFAEDPTTTVAKPPGGG